MEKEYWVKLGAFILVLFVFVSIMQTAAMVGIVFKDLRGPSSSIFVLGLCGVSYSIFLWFRYIGQSIVSDDKHEVTKPVVRVWTINGFTRVIPDLDWRLWQKLNERNMLVGFARKGMLPDPPVCIMFRDNPVGGWFVGNMRACQSLLDGCRVERTEMYVPNFSRNNVFDFNVAWKMIHGHDSVPPEVNAPAE